MESTKIDFSTFDTLLEFLCNSQLVPQKLTEEIIYLLVTFKSIVIDPPQEFTKDDSLQTESFVRDVGSIFSSFDLNKMNEYMGLTLCLQLREFFNSASMSIIERIKENRPKLPPSYYPKTSAFVFIDHLLENLDELLKDVASSTRPFNFIIMKVQMELRFWYSDLIEISSNPPLFLKEAIDTVRKLAYDVEYALDLFLVGDVPTWRCIFWLDDIVTHFQKIEQERRKTEIEEDLKGKKTMIYDELLGGDEQLNIITIVGPSGTGKTAFVKELYDSPPVIDHFASPSCFRFYISYSDYTFYDDERRELLDILGQLVDLSDITYTKNYEELTILVYECLKGQRFLGVIDDLRRIYDWDRIRRCFPDSHNGSRIVLTTEMREFSFTAKPTSIVQPLYPQNDKFWESSFRKLSCPAEMFEVGSKIAKRCKPESETWVVHLLQTIQKTVNQWEQVAQTLGSRVFGLKGSQEKRILDLTFFFLPDHLRSCFFYLELFCRQEKFLVSKVIRLWIAEGFVKHTASQSLEDTSEDYVADLIARNLLVLTEEKSLGRAKTCHLIPVVSHFLSGKVMEDNFLQVNFTTGDDYSSSPTIYYQRRLLLHSKWDEFVTSCGPFVHSLFYCQSHTYDAHKNPQSISFIYKNFKFLRILKLEFVKIGDSFKEVGVLVLLKYLEVISSVKVIPPSIANLENLETFLFKQSRQVVVKVPDCIWDMTKLRHFHIRSFPSFDLELHRLENFSSFLDNLQTFSRPSLAYGDDMEKILRRLKSIRKLYCVFLDSWDDAKKCNQFPVLEFLNNLISLKVDYNGHRKYPCEFNFPSNLKKLTLERFRMPWNEISKLAILNNLEVLKLIDDAFEGERWELEDHVVFAKLKYLQLGSMKVVYWNATHYQFPHLERLAVVLCEKLVEVPQDFAYISSIQMIEVKWRCTPSAEKSAKLIQEQHMKHWGHNRLKISCEYNNS